MWKHAVFFWCFPSIRGFLSKIGKVNKQILGEIHVALWIQGSAARNALKGYKKLGGKVKHLLRRNPWIHRLDWICFLFKVWAPWLPKLLNRHELTLRFGIYWTPSKPPYHPFPQFRYPPGPEGCGRQIPYIIPCRDPPLGLVHFLLPNSTKIQQKSDENLTTWFQGISWSWLQALTGFTAEQPSVTLGPLASFFGECEMPYK